MPVTIGSNIASLKAQRQIGRTTDALSSTYERLSSGQRINKASDDAAGLAIASSLNASSRIFAQGIRNINDGISAISIGEGALHELNLITQRQTELAEQAANGTYNAKQRKALHNEANALVDEFNRIVASTEFNGRKILDGSFEDVRIQAGVGLTGSLSIGIGAELDRAVGTGSFTASATMAAVIVAPGPFAFDANGDGKMDLYSVGDNQAFYGNGDGTFQAGVTRSSGFVPNIAAGILDSNQDGRTDLMGLSAGGTAYINVSVQNANGTFSISQSLAAPTTFGNAYLRSGDFNGDGADDIIAVNFPTDEFLAYFNNGDGTFKAGVTYTTGDNPQDITIGDLNGDGINDIAEVNFSILDNTVGIRYGQRNGTFSAYTSFTSTMFNPRQIFASDYNRDGHQDLLVVNTGGLGRVFSGNGGGAFTAEAFFNTGATNISGQLTDLNGDGLEDYVNFYGLSNAININYGNGDGTFQSVISSVVRMGNFTWGMADFNTDGVQDFYTSNYLSSISVDLANTQNVTTIAKLNLMSRQSALGALDIIASTRNRLTTEIGRIGSYQSRLSVASSNLGTAVIQYQGAESRIKDADIAADSANLVRQQILQQAAAAVLSQANQEPALALTLLK